MEAIILANGEFPHSEHLVEMLRMGKFLICCDGAANHCHRMGITPNIVIGDADSLSEEARTAYADRIIAITEQETNDLTKAFKYALSQGYTEITILGATGLREDHSLGNIALLMDYAEEARVKMLSDYGSFYPCKEVCELRMRKGQELSIFNFGAAGFHAEGLMYPLYDFKKLWQGTLNVAIAERVRITADGVFLVYVQR